MNTDDRSIDELITNESFISWVLNPESDPSGYWDQYQKEHLSDGKKIASAIQLVKKLNSAKNIPTSDQKNKMLDAIHKGINLENSTQSKGFNWSMLGKIAAMLVFVLGTYFIFDTNSEKQFTTNYNEIENINLPDGSQVVLNANSSLVYSGNWQNSAEREVWLEGEAYFKVTKAVPKKGKKFVVHTQDLEVTVLGTQFNVNTHKPETDVVLEEGRIDIKIIRYNHPESEENISMVPGQKASFNPIVKKYQISKVNSEVYTSWKDGTLVFDGTPLSELKNIIEHNYGYQVEFENEKLLSKKLDGKINNPNLETLLSTLETIFNLQIEKNGKRIIIKE